MLARLTLLSCLLVLAGAPPTAQALTVLAPQTLGASWGAPVPLLDAAGTAYAVGLDARLMTAPFGGRLAEVATPAPDTTTRPWEAQGALGDAGELLVAFTRRGTRARVYRRVQVVVRAADGSSSRPRTVSRPGRSADTPAIAGNARGDAIVAFARHDADARWHVQYAYRPAAGAFAAARTVTGEVGVIKRAGPIGVAVSPRGGGVLTWATRPRSRRDTGRLVAMLVRPDGSHGAPVTLEERAAGDSYGVPHTAVVVAYGGDGRGVIAWPREPTRLAGDRLMAATVSADAIGNPATVFSTRGPLIGWDVAAGADGRATAVWASYPGFGADVPGDRVTATVRAASRTADGGWTATRTLSHAGVHVSPGGQGRLGVQAAGNARGDVVAVWSEQSTYVGGDERVWAAARTSTGGWGDATAITPVGGRDFLPGVALNDAGQLLLSWMAFPSPTGAAGGSMAFGTLGTPARRG